MCIGWKAKKGEKMEGKNIEEWKYYNLVLVVFGGEYSK